MRITSVIFSQSSTLYLDMYLSSLGHHITLRKIIPKGRVLVWCHTFLENLKYTKIKAFINVKFKV